MSVTRRDDDEPQGFDLRQQRNAARGGMLLARGDANRLREAGNEVIAAWDAMDGTEARRGALMGAFGALRLALGRR